MMLSLIVQGILYETPAVRLRSVPISFNLGVVYFFIVTAFFVAVIRRACRAGSNPKHTSVLFSPHCLESASTHLQSAEDYRSGIGSRCAYP